jgi:hypothetical protein
MIHNSGAKILVGEAIDNCVVILEALKNLIIGQTKDCNVGSDVWKHASQVIRVG